MGAFPQSIYFQGLNEPVGQEFDLRGLHVEGDLPAEVRGSFYRAVPDPAFAPMFDTDHTLSGDGMVSRLSFNADGTADFAQKYVETARYKAEKAAGKALFGKYRNPFTDDASVSGVDRTVANTTPVWHAGRLLMAKEDGRPYQVDPITLETIGSYDFGGALKSETMTAHVRIDAATGRRAGFGQSGLLRGGSRWYAEERAVVRCALLRDDARFHDQRELCAVPDLSDDGRP